MAKIPTNTVRKISTTFQKRLLDLMNEFGYNNSTLAKAVKISTPVITRATIYGIIPSVLMLIKLADHFNVSIAYLLGDSDSEVFNKSDGSENFHTRLEALTKKRKTTYAKIAASMPFTKNYFYEWQREKTLPSLEYLQAIADYFEESIDYLLGRED